MTDAGAPVRAQAHAHATALPLDAIVIALGAVAAIAYLLAVLGAARRGRPWPIRRTALWLAGVAAGVVGAAGPLAAASHQGFVAHAWAHLVGGMVAPLLLVLAAPVTLALRALPVAEARQLSRLLRSRPAALLAHPIAALVLSAGGLWVLYRSPLVAWMHQSPLVHVAVHVHLLLAGALFVSAVLAIDPSPHRASFRVRAAALVASMASHGILMRFLAAHPPAGVDASDALAGAETMATAGGWVDAVTVLALFALWYRAADPARSRIAGGRRAATAGTTRGTSRSAPPHPRGRASTAASRCGSGRATAS